MVGCVQSGLCWGLSMKKISVSKQKKNCFALILKLKLFQAQTNRTPETYDLIVFILLQINRNQASEGNEEKKGYEDKDIFHAQKEVCKYDQVGALH